VAQNPLNAAARWENVRALALAAGLSEEEASERLDRRILVTHDANDPASLQLISELIRVLSRTVAVALGAPDGISPYAAELVVGCATPQTGGPHVFAVLCEDRCIIRRERSEKLAGAPTHALLALIAACYVSAAAIHCAVGDGLPNPPPPEFDIPFDAFLDGGVNLFAPVDLGDAYLAGAGAIGNGFLWAARHAPLRGQLHVVDDDIVSAGNLQRQIWFDGDDVGKPKAESLCRKAQPLMPNLRLMQSVCRLQEHRNRSDGAWLPRLIVAVDSRRARRHLQNELPGEVFDASTTGSQEIVLHYNRQPTDLACLGCIYTRDEQEVTHEQAVAAHLGVSIEAVRQERIDSATARRICATHAHLAPSSIEGLAFDTLYKQLCSSGQLKSVSGKQVVAPFAFVSVLAGALLLLEVVRRHNGNGDALANDWRVNPWRPPVAEMRHRRPRRPGCECCGRAEVRRVNALLWGGRNSAGSMADAQSAST